MQLHLNWSFENWECESQLRIFMEKSHVNVPMQGQKQNNARNLVANWEGIGNLAKSSSFCNLFCAAKNVS